jgi:hypothetical protein
MELTYVTIVVLASMIFVLSGMVGYLYWQQTRMLQHLQSLAMVVSTRIPPAIAEPEVEPEDEPEPQPEPEAEPDHASGDGDDEDEDDRITVEIVDGPPAVTVDTDEGSPMDIDTLDKKTMVDLRTMLTHKGIPFGKRDPKTVLIQLLKATA